MNDELIPDDDAPESEQQAKKLAAIRAGLFTPVTTAKLQPGQEPTLLTRLDIIGHSWRRTATQLLEPASFTFQASARERPRIC